MKKTIIIFIIGIVIGSFFIGSNILTNRAIINDKKEVKLPNNLGSDFEANIDLYTTIFSLDENHNPIDGFKYELSTWNNKVSATFVKDNTFNNYYTDYYRNIDFEEAYDLLSNVQKEAVDEVKTYGDFYDTWLKELDDVENHFSPCEADYNNSNRVVCYSYMPTYFVVKQTSVPSGYTKQKYIIPGYISLNYYFEHDVSLPGGTPVSIPNRNHELTLGSIEISPYSSEDFLFDYDNYDNILLKTNFDTRTFDTEIYYDLSIYSDSDCHTDTFRIDDRFINDRQGKFNPPNVSYNGYCAPAIINKRGTPSLTISSFVNEKENITITKSGTLEYKVEINNKGDSAAYDNVIVSKLPAEFTYVEGSTTRGGVYDPDTHTVTWNVMKLDADESINFRYEVNASSDLVSLKNYESVATIESSSINERIVSNKATVKLLSNIISNPKTNAPIYGIGITLLITWGVAIYLYIDKKRKLIRQ